MSNSDQGGWEWVWEYPDSYIVDPSVGCNPFGRAFPNTERCKLIPSKPPARSLTSVSQPPAQAIELKRSVPFRQVQVRKPQPVAAAAAPVKPQTPPPAPVLAAPVKQQEAQWTVVSSKQRKSKTQVKQQRSVPRTKPKVVVPETNLVGFLPSQFQRSVSRKSSVSSTSVWTPSSSQNNPWKASVSASQKLHSRRNSTLSVSSVSSSRTRSQTPEANPVQQQQKLRVVKPKTTSAPKKPQQQLTYRQKMAQKKVEIHEKEEVCGQLAPGRWYKAPKGKSADAVLAEQKRIRNQRQASQQAANFRRKGKKAAQRQTPNFKPKASDKTVNDLKKKLRKKVKDCNKIAEAQRRGQRLEKNQVEKLKMLKTYQTQLRKLERTGKAVDNDGYQTVF